MIGQTYGTQKRKQRLYTIALTLASAGIGLGLLLSAFRENVIFFYTPSDLVTRDIPSQKTIRLGGVVAQGSFKSQTQSLKVSFEVTDLKKSIPVAYEGSLPDLFREGQGVVVQGVYKEGYFQAKQVLAKHDESYMPPEVAKSMGKEHISLAQKTVRGR